MRDTDIAVLLAELAALMPRVEQALRGRLGEAAGTPLSVPPAPHIRLPVGDDWLLVEEWPPHPSICNFSDRVTWITPGEAQTLLHLRSESATRERIRRRPVSVKVGGILHVNRFRLLAPTGSLPGEDR